MKYGFIRTAAATPDIKVCDCDFNADNIIKNVKTAYENNTEIIVFPELYYLAILVEIYLVKEHLFLHQ